MGSKVWKKFEQSDGFRRAKLKWKHLIGKEPKFTYDVVVQLEDYSGWQLAADFISDNDVVYSLGICDDIDFELDSISKKNVNIYAFDPTPYSVTWVNSQQLPPQFKFFPWAASGTDGTFFLYPRIKKNGERSTTMFTFHQQEKARTDGVKVKALSIHSIAKELKHDSVDILKMDIEGSEYEVIESWLQSELRPKMLLVEFHHRFKGIGKGKTIDAVASLRAHDYLLASISITGREMCFVHKLALENLSTKHP